jgi:hypothetical protein
VWGAGFGAKGLGYRVWGARFVNNDSGFRVHDLACMRFSI